MYSDRVGAETGSKKTAKNRLNGGSGTFSTRRRQIKQKSIRLETKSDKWEHDLFEDDKPRITNSRVHPSDLRLKLQKNDRGSLDLRDKLSGTRNPPKFKREAHRLTVKKVAGETRTASSNKATKKKSEQADASVDSFLESLGLEKYSTAFQVEEVDMDALLHMTDDDLKSMLIPMGPRKKILLALESKRG